MGPRKQAKDLRKGSSWELLLAQHSNIYIIYIYICSIYLMRIKMGGGVKRRFYRSIGFS